MTANQHMRAYDGRLKRSFRVCPTMALSLSGSATATTSRLLKLLRVARNDRFRMLLRVAKRRSNPKGRKRHRSYAVQCRAAVPGVNPGRGAKLSLCLIWTRVAGNNRITAPRHEPLRAPPATRNTPRTQPYTRLAQRRSSGRRRRSTRPGDGDVLLYPGLWYRVQGPLGGGLGRGVPCTALRGKAPSSAAIHFLERNRPWRSIR